MQLMATYVILNYRNLKHISFSGQYGQGSSQSTASFGRGQVGQVGIGQAVSRGQGQYGQAGVGQVGIVGQVRN